MHMNRILIRFISFFALVLLTVGCCSADQPAGQMQLQNTSGVITGNSLGTEKNVTYNCSIFRDADGDFVLIGFEGSRMDPRKEGGSVIWTAGLGRFNIIDFSIADELCAWQTKKWESVNESYSAAVADVLREHFGEIKAVGIYAFSKGASAVDSVCRRLKESGIRIAFIWLNDAFATHGIPFVKELTETGETMLYNRYSRDERVNQLSKKLHNDCSELPNVDSKHIRTYHGGLVKYDTFSDELNAAVEKASFVP